MLQSCWFITPILTKANHALPLFVLKGYVLPLPLPLGLGRYGQQLYRYVFDTDLADTIRIRYDTHAHYLRFQNQECWISTTECMFWVDPHLNLVNASAKAK